jgi:hypothetical protein
MRDLATYESNFSEETNLRSVLLRMHKLVYDSKLKIDKLKEHEQETWVDPKLSTMFSETFDTIKLVQQMKKYYDDLQVINPLKKKTLVLSAKSRKITSPLTSEIRRMVTSSL